MRTLLPIAALLFSGSALASFEMSGKIIRLFVSETGSIAVRLDKNYNDSAKQACPGFNGWAGNVSADPILKSTLLAAHASKTNVALSISGCTAGGAWVKVAAVYSD
ncbi:MULTISPECIES: hypothetical protein [Pseudoalteromonas]|uniref:hypothetical protein n=1 Tax=Pseudoalteromonas TaxID=53246 RepID=UPI000F768983|nr:MULTISPECIES: hypothetical protein [Pseudoalteromonas]MEC4088705.1 hypothetical protein [Pseudoalteromonas rubra]